MENKMDIQADIINESHNQTSKANNDVITFFYKSIENMEDKLKKLQNELNYVIDERKRVEQNYLTNDRKHQKQCIDDEKFQQLQQQPTQDDAKMNNIDLLLVQIKNLQIENKQYYDDIIMLKKQLNTNNLNNNDYRDKYLKTQQLIEEQKRHIDYIENENQLIQDQINSELKLANDKFNEELQELRHLPYLLEAKYIEIQETQHKLKIAEKTVNALSSDLESCIIKCELLVKDLEKERETNVNLQHDAISIKNKVTNWEMRYQELLTEKDKLIDATKKIQMLEKQYEEKLTENNKLKKYIDDIRDDNLRHVARIKDRHETQKRSLTGQVNCLEKEMLQIRSQLNTALKERDETRFRMQNEVSRLERKFGDAQLEIKTLKNNLDILKTSYTNLFDGYDTDYESDAKPKQQQNQLSPTYQQHMEQYDQPQQQLPQKQPASPTSLKTMNYH